MMADLNMACQIVSDMVKASLFGANFRNTLGNTDFKLY